jgi:hypothetical protein
MMSFPSWLRNPGPNRPPRGRAHRHPAPRFRPRFEALEDRAVPSTLTVTNTLDNWSSGSLRSEIGVAQSGDTIVFDPSLGGQTITLTQGELGILTSVTIDATAAGHVTVSGGYDVYGNHSRVFEVAAATNVTLTGLGIINGWDFSSFYGTDPRGGGILNFGTLTLRGCAVQGNEGFGISGAGGGIYNAGTLSISDSTVSDNFATAGGGIYNEGGRTTTVSNCTISNNTAGDGGGIYNAYPLGTKHGPVAGTVTVTNNSTITNNTASGGDGGGIFNDHSALTVSGGAVSANAAYAAADSSGLATGGAGGGIYTTGTATVGGTALAGNSAHGVYASGRAVGGNGGGIVNGGSLKVSGCALSANAAYGAVSGGISYGGGAGGGIFNVGTATVGANSILSANTAADQGAGIYNGGTLTVSNSGLVDNSVAINPTATPGVASGGGIFNGFNGTLTVSGCTLTGNSASIGGGIFNFGKATVQSGTTVSGNSASIEGGGIFNDSTATLTISDSTVTGNDAPLGADIYNLGHLRLRRSTVGVIGP